MVNVFIVASMGPVAGASRVSRSAASARNWCQSWAFLRWNEAAHPKMRVGSQQQWSGDGGWKLEFDQLNGTDGFGLAVAVDDIAVGGRTDVGDGGLWKTT